MCVFYYVGKLVYVVNKEADYEGWVVVWLTSTSLVGDSPARAEGTGSFQSGHCILCGVVQTNYSRSLRGTCLQKHRGQQVYFYGPAFVFSL